ncbi:hypothetical protein AVEN_113584-1 [Araneus ventricosus]|uniref:Uncharacterized protein n=1 Tax=Araneus ventricosus TaxID=182803 RepID=A0A4Y2JGU8_ARAVE|nr:hypothetical protein AVEN_113584-1 [Araneus ventricosus]
MPEDTPDFGDKLDDQFGDKMKVSENARIVALSLLGMELWSFFWNFPCDVTPCRKDYKYRAANEESNLFGVLFAERFGQLLDAERYR